MFAERFLEAAKRLTIEASSCLVIEDSLLGVTAGKAAGMEIIAIPSIPKQSELYTSADEVLNPLLDLQPEKWRLPPFQDWIECTLPIEPWYIGGPIIKGYGCGRLQEYPSGVYFGWAGLDYQRGESIRWSQKTIEPWLLHDFDEDFYGEELQLAIVGYIRPEANFPFLESLIEKIHEDRKIAEKALELPLYIDYKSSPYLISRLNLSIKEFRKFSVAPSLA